MPSPVVSFVIGSATLAIVSLLIISSFTGLGLMFQADVVKYELQELSEKIASTMVELAVLAKSSKSEEIFLVKKLNIPKSLMEKGYVINLTREEGNWKVSVYIEGWPGLKGESPLNFREIEVEVDLTMELTSFNPPVHVEGREVKHGGKIHSGVQKPVVWCSKTIENEHEEIKVGLGAIE